LTAIPVQRRCSQLHINKETPYRSPLRDPQGKAEPIIGGVLTIPEELETVILSDKAYTIGFLKCKKYRKHTYLSIV
ncbi:hypothetical protein H8356DRAFT_951326, partial [Neocallimastix lanati (nom. inval.)]